MFDRKSFQVQPLLLQVTETKNEIFSFMCGQFCYPASGVGMAQLMSWDFCPRDPFLGGITEHSLPSFWHFEMWNTTDKMTFISSKKISLDSYRNHFFFLFERPEWQFMFKCSLEWEGIFSDKLLAVQELCPSVHLSKSFDRSWGYSFH